MSLMAQAMKKAKKLETRELASLPARVALGASMTYHGLDKLRSLGPTAQVMESLGFRPGKPWALALGAAEFTAGALTLAGVGTRLASTLVLVTQATAINKVHRPKGYDSAKGGFEYNLALIAIATGLLIAGPGKPSLKAWLARRMVKRRPLPFVRSHEPLAMRLLQ